MTDCWKRSTPMEISYKPHAIQADEQSFDSGTDQKPIVSILYAALCTRPDTIYATSVLGRYAAQLLTLH